MTEKREFKRIQYNGFCILSREESEEVETWRCRIINIAAHGALIECPDNWPGAKNDNVRMTLILDENAVDIDIKMSGIIVRQQPGVLGVDFIMLNLDSLAHLESVIKLNIAKDTLLDKKTQNINNG